MAVASTSVQDEELVMGTEQQKWEEEDDEEGRAEQDFERYFDENGVLMMEDQAVQGIAHNGAFAADDDNILGLEEDNILGLKEQDIFTLDENGIMVFEEQDAYYPQSSPSLSGAFSIEEKHPQSKTMEQRSYDWSDRRDSNSLPTSSSMGERSAGHNISDSIEDLEPENLNSLEEPQLWIPIRDRQLDMTEDEQDKASSVELEGPEVNFGPEGSEEEEFPDFPYDGQYQSDNNLSVEVMLDSSGVYEEYQKVLDNVQMAENDWEPLDGSPDHARGPAEYPYQSDDGSEDSGQEGAYRISQLGETLGFPSELPASFSEVQMGTEEPNLPTDSSRWKMSQSLLSHVSMEDLQNGPVIDDETFPESSYTESVDDSAAVGFTMSNRGHRPSQSHLALAKKIINRQDEHVQKVQLPNTGQQSSTKLSRRAQTLKIPALLPSKTNRQSRSFSPNRNTVDKKTARSRSPRPSPTAEPSTYGRGQLNYPLPDFSKVEPRVKFDQSYRPPKRRNLLRRPGETEAPLVFKSPAEIVREVLLSSTEGSPQKMTFTNATVPEEFKSPRQATELVNQLQEDYNRLLTKYAEAENTIDRLRLETKVHLYSDPPKPSHSVPMGTVSQGSKFMTFTIPQAHVAQFGQMPSQSQYHGTIPTTPGHDATEDHEATGEHRISAERSNIGKHSAAGEDGTTSQVGSLPDVYGGRSINEPSSGEYLTQTLAKQTEKFQRQVESFERLIQMGTLSPQEQLKGLQRLKGAQDALERAYLQAREEHRLLKQRREPGGSHGEFDPDRAVEGEIFRLGMQVEELKDGIDQAMQSQPAPSIHPEPMPSHSILATTFSDHIIQPPSPSAVTPIPAVRTPYPENPIPKESVSHTQVEVSSASSESEGGDALPKPLRHKRADVEKGFNHLLGQYNSFKTLPDAMGLESEFGEKKSPREEGNAPRVAGRGRRTWRRPSLKEEKSQTAPQPQPMEVKPSLPEKALDITSRHSQAPSIGGKESNPKSSAVKPSAPTMTPKSLPFSHQSPASRQISENLTLSENLPQKRYLQSKVLPSQDRIVSPETDSGFIGSDGSRISPQTPDQNSPHRRSFQEHSQSPSLSPPNARTMEKPSSSHTRFIRMPDRLAKKPATTGLRSSLKKDGQPTSTNKVPHVTLASVSDIPFRRNDQRQSGSQGGTPRGSRTPPNSPPRWSNSVTDSENEQDADIAPVDSETEDHSDAGTFPTNGTSLRSLSISATPSLSPPGTQTWPDPLGSRLARNDAINALQDEVSRLRQRLEQTMQRPQRTRSQPTMDFPSPRTSKLFSRIPSEGTQEAFEEPSRRMKPSVRMRSLSLPLEELDQELSLEADRSLHRTRSQTSQPEWATRHSSERQAGASSFTGPYTGAEYHLSSPRSLTPEATLIMNSFCPQCQGTRDSSPDTFSVSGTRKQVIHSTPKKVIHSTPQTTCPLCSGNKNNWSPDVKPVPVLDEGRGATSSQSSETTAKAGKKKQVPPPGVWVMAGPPSPSPVASYIQAVPYVPYSPSLVFCASPVSTSTSPGSSRLYYPSGYRVKELQVPEVQQPRRRHRRSMTLGIEDLEDLRWSLSRAVEAAQSMKVTTKKMSRSLTCDLSNVKNLRESCLF